MNILGELRQRKVLQTAALYFAGAWGATEILSYLIERIPIFPAWADTAIAILFVLGFPVAIFLSWMFDAGRDGVRRANPASGMGRGVIVLSMVVLLGATGALSYLLLPKIEAERGLIHEGDFGTVAVLPFENLTGDPSLGYLGMGLSEDVRQRLAMFTDLKIIGRVSMAGFAMGGADLASVRGLLDAGLVVEGSLQNPAGQMRVSVALLETATGRQMWSNTFSAGDAGWEPLRLRIVTALAEQLAVTVRLKEQAAPVPDEALEAYLRGLSELSQPEVADRWFDEAIRLAPDFADAWARKALLRVDMIWHGMKGQQAWEESEPLLVRARDIEPNNLMADIAEAQLTWLARYEPIAAYEILQRAEKLAPNHPLVLGGIANSLRYIPGQLEAAEQYGRRYLAQDPLNPDAHLMLGTALTFQHRYEEGFPYYERAEQLDPGYLLTYEYRANQEFFRRSPADALATLTRRAQVEGSPSDETQRCMLYIAGELLPANRAIPLLQFAVQQRKGMSEFHAWCPNPLEILVERFEGTGRKEEADQARMDLERFRNEGAAISDSNYRAFETEETENCEDMLCRIRLELGDEVFEQWLGPNPPLTAFTGELTVNLVKALKEAGRTEEGQRLAELAAPVMREYAGPEGHPSVSGATVMIMALSGDVDGALDYAMMVGPEGFYVFGSQLNSWANDIGIPELISHPRWSSFIEVCDARLQTEVEKFDRMVASGEIVMP